MQLDVDYRHVARSSRTKARRGSNAPGSPLGLHLPVAPGACQDSGHLTSARCRPCIARLEALAIDSLRSTRESCTPLTAIPGAMPGLLRVMSAPPLYPPAWSKWRWTRAWRTCRGIRTGPPSKGPRPVPKPPPHHPAERTPSSTSPHEALARARPPGSAPTSRPRSWRLPSPPAGSRPASPSPLVDDASVIGTRHSRHLLQVTASPPSCGFAVPPP